MKEVYEIIGKFKPYHRYNCENCRTTLDPERTVFCRVECEPGEIEKELVELEKEIDVRYDDGVSWTEELEATRLDTQRVLLALPPSVAPALPGMEWLRDGQ